jgi:deoxyribodipyrimidine photo-lyase
MSAPTTALVWFRRDLRLGDNPAWAAGTGADRVVACFVVDAVPWSTAGPFRLGLMTGHLRSLDASLRALGGALVVLEGDPRTEVPGLARRLGAAEVHANIDATTYSRRRDAEVAAALETVGARLVQHAGNHVHAPGTIASPSTGSVHRVFTPFSKAWAAAAWAPWPEPGPAVVTAPDDPGTLPAPGAEPAMSPGEDAAHERLAAWLDHVDGYRDRRDVPADGEGTSHLSADLRWGTIAARTAAEVVGTATDGRAAFVRQLAWRDWYAHLLWQYPQLARRALAPEMDTIVWRDDPEGFAAWQEGRTGYPIVDAGMRELAATGWMHNRVRMITASFLVKDLLIDWRAGEAHFRRLLVDWEVSQNVGNWQWVAGTGPDAAPYFRIFNPIAQGRKFDPAGDYVRRWVPELADVPAPAIHAPWEVGPLELAGSGVVLGETYPHPIVDHPAARERTLAVYGEAKARAAD